MNQKLNENILALKIDIEIRAAYNSVHIDENGIIDNLVASGTVELNNTVLFTICKWNCRINANGIQHESELTKNEK
jgi:hypothetical protein